MPTNIATPTPVPGPSLTNGGSHAVGTVLVTNGQILVYNGTLWVPLGNVSEETMAKFAITYKARNVNSKRLLQRVVSTVEDTCDEFIVHRSNAINKTYDFSQLVDYLDAYFEELCVDKVVNKFDVIGDFRNNTNDEIKQGKINIEVKFQQFNCINITDVAFKLIRV